MKLNCFDTSGLSTPFASMPEDIPAFAPMWGKVVKYFETGVIATSKEVYDEMCNIEGKLGKFINDNSELILLEIGDDTWNYTDYLHQYNQMRKTHEPYISEYSHGKSKKTICLSDLTVIAMAKVLNVPVVSSESSAAPSKTKCRIPDICFVEGITHFTFNDFLRLEKI